MEIKISEKAKRIPIDGPNKIARMLEKILEAEEEADKQKEHFWGIYLNGRTIIIRIELISLGTVNTSLIHPRETYRPAIKSSSTSLIIAHNHPSGDPTPSEDDIDITHRMKKAGEILGIRFHDHVIIGKGRKFYSFLRHGLLTSKKEGRD